MTYDAKTLVNVLGLGAGATDRELLELAAKAVRYTLSDDGYAIDQNGDVVTFDPEDDGDTLRLAVDLHICTLFPMQGDSFKLCGAGQVGSQRPACMEPYGPDPRAATRRAIWRAAAAIGEGMK